MAALISQNLLSEYDEQNSKISIAVWHDEQSGKFAFVSGYDETPPLPKPASPHRTGRAVVPTTLKR